MSPGRALALLTLAEDDTRRRTIVNGAAQARGLGGRDDL